MKFWRQFWAWLGRLQPRSAQAPRATITSPYPPKGAYFGSYVLYRAQVAMQDLENACPSKTYHFARCKRIVAQLKNADQRAKLVRQPASATLFLVYADATHQRWVALRPCKACLATVGLGGVAPEDFDLMAYLESKDIQPNGFEAEAVADFARPIINDYPSMWPLFSLRRRQAAHYRCQRCGVDCSHPTNRSLIQTHHINRIKSDCRDENLVVLCAQCHQALHIALACEAEKDPTKHTAIQWRRYQGICTVADLMRLEALRKAQRKRLPKPHAKIHF